MGKWSKRFNFCLFVFFNQDKGQLVFEEQWPLMRPTILKLLRQEPVSRAEWHELFWSVHMVCLWDEKSHAKMYKALQDDILEFIKQAQTVSILRENLHFSQCWIWKKKIIFFSECWHMRKISHCSGLISVNGASSSHSAPIFQCLSSSWRQPCKGKVTALFRKSLNRIQMIALSEK